MLRRHLWRWTSIAVILIATAISAAAPSSALALSPPHPDGCPGGQWQGTGLGFTCVQDPRVAGLRHVGWTYLNLNHCAAGMVCAAVYRDSTLAWSWTGSAWRQASLRQGWVYVYPYTGEWRWAWTQQTGWVAISGGRFEVRAY